MPGPLQTVTGWRCEGVLPGMRFREDAALIDYQLVR
jgi:hypothetical protein